jgi:glutamate--cysteine ligase
LSVGGLSEAMLLDDLRQRFFSPSHSPAPLTIGIELELIPVFASTHLPALPATTAAVSTADVLLRIGEREGWTLQPAGNDPPSWTLTDGSRISFEPGGQIEISSAPDAHASFVIDAVRAVVATLREAMHQVGIDLLAAGVDPFNGIDAVPLQLHRARYTRMTRFFESIGPSGIRMMRQTAAVQINVERGADPLKRWSLLNALAPYVVALFANSPRYAGQNTGHASFRAHLWRTLDASRTGLPFDPTDPVRRYLDFALDAKALGSSDGTTAWVSFRNWMRGGNPGREDWLFHLSTLFPEVRPKEFFEIRSADTIDERWLAAPIVFLTALVYDEESASRSATLIGANSQGLLERAGREGLKDAEIRRAVTRLAELALDGATRLGNEYISAADVQIAREYFLRRLSGY